MGKGPLHACPDVQVIVEQHKGPLIRNGLHQFMHGTLKPFRCGRVADRFRNPLGLLAVPECKASPSGWTQESRPSRGVGTTIHDGRIGVAQQREVDHVGAHLTDLVIRRPTKWSIGFVEGLHFALGCEP